MTAANERYRKARPTIEVDESLAVSGLYKWFGRMVAGDHVRAELSDDGLDRAAVSLDEGPGHEVGDDAMAAQRGVECRERLTKRFRRQIHG